MRIQDICLRSTSFKYTEIRLPSQWQTAASVQGLWSSVSFLPSNRDPLPLFCKGIVNLLGIHALCVTVQPSAVSFSLWHEQGWHVVIETTIL
jgi:hypothetical protein